MAARRLVFKIPLQTEIQVYMKERKGWPDAFTLYYAEKFWNNYQSAGWKLSNGNLMKDWRAAFNAQWQNLKYPEDIEMLKKYGGKPEAARVLHIQTGKPVQNEPPAPKTQLEQLEQVLSWFKQSPAIWTLKALQGWAHLQECYSAIKENRLWSPEITKSEVQRVQAENSDPNYLKAVILLRTFEWYGRTGWTFSDTIVSREKLK